MWTQYLQELCPGLRCCEGFTHDPDAWLGSFQSSWMMERAQCHYCVVVEHLEGDLLPQALEPTVHWGRQVCTHLWDSLWQVPQQLRLGLCGNIGEGTPPGSEGHGSFGAFYLMYLGRLCLCTASPVLSRFGLSLGCFLSHGRSWLFLCSIWESWWLLSCLCGTADWI